MNAGLWFRVFYEPVQVSNPKGNNQFAKVQPTTPLEPSQELRVKR